MSSPTSAPENQGLSQPRPAMVPRAMRQVGSDGVAAAILQELRSLFPGLTISHLTSGTDTDDAVLVRASPGEIRVISARPPADDDRSAAPVLVSGTAARTAATVVAAAVDDDASAGRVLRHAAWQARRRRLPLRVVHVWTGRAISVTGALMNRHDQIAAADRLLSAVLYDQLTPVEAEAAEREILHDRDVVRALLALSGEVSLVVIAASSGRADAKPLGDTVRALIGRTACPVAVLPPCAEPVATACTW
ncbi:hypothetical protein DMB66_45070 [Actinoplanes sp. ATCC 53533]|nr:hypothetical protein DMB66_45070 [Actinoplanes sp. ATCC 53533]